MPYLDSWKDYNESFGHKVSICHTKHQLGSGDILFLVSCSEKVGVIDRAKFRHVLVLHASDLPRGRGWSPHVWEIISGSTEVTLSLIEASDVIDTGNVWNKVKIVIPKHFLWNEINDALFKAEIELINWAIDNLDKVNPSAQVSSEAATYWPKRTPQDSYIDINRSISEQFDILRVCDPNRFPAYFEIYGRKYKLRLEYYDEEK